MIITFVPMLIVRFVLPPFVRHGYVTKIGKIHPIALRLSQSLTGRRFHSRPTRTDLGDPGNDKNSFRVHTIPCFTDNYAYLVIDTSGGAENKALPAAIVDACDADAIMEDLENMTQIFYCGREIDIQCIMTTHHHWDHQYGNVPLKKKLKSIRRIYGGSEDRVDGCTHAVDDGDVIRVGNLRFGVLKTPCHTRGSVVYRLYSRDGCDCIFAGDTIFVGGSGGPFEGSNLEMVRNFWHIRRHVPETSLLFPGHEYTVDILATYFPSSNAMISRPSSFLAWSSTFARALHLRCIQWPVPTVPWRLSVEMKYNRHFEAIRESADTLQSVCRAIEESCTPLPIEDIENFISVGNEDVDFFDYEEESVASYPVAVTGRRSARPWVWHESQIDQQMSFHWKEDFERFVAFVRRVVPLSYEGAVDRAVQRMAESAHHCAMPKSQQRLPALRRRRWAGPSAEADGARPHMWRQPSASVHGGGTSNRAVGSCRSRRSFALHPPADFGSVRALSADDYGGGGSIFGGTRSLRPLSSRHTRGTSAPGGARAHLAVSPRGVRPPPQAAMAEDTRQFMPAHVEGLPPTNAIRQAVLVFSRSSSESRRAAHTLSMTSFVDAVTTVGEDPTTVAIAEAVWRLVVGPPSLPSSDALEEASPATEWVLAEAFVAAIVALGRRPDAGQSETMSCCGPAATASADVEPAEGEAVKASPAASVRTADGPTLHDSDRCRYCRSARLVRDPSSPAARPATPQAKANVGDSPMISPPHDGGADHSAV
eukprot:Polyplicarium_translucidae@DN2071_c0_g1_i1.p1